MRVLCIPDLHVPFHNQNAMAFLRALKRQHRPDVVIVIGDVCDQHGWSRHPRLPDSPGQQDEDEQNLAFLRELYRVFPRAKACIGNHDERVAKACNRAGLPPRLRAGIADVYQSPPDWDWQYSHVVDEVAYEHGSGYSGKDAAIRAARRNGMPTAIGHIHSAAGVQYEASRYGINWGLAVGCLVDVESVAMRYARDYAAKPVLGAAVVLDRVPFFIPLL